MTTTQPRRPARGAGGATQAHCRVSLLPLSARSVAVALELTDAEQRISECMSEVLDDACRGIPAGTELHGHRLTCSGVIDRRREMGRTTFADVVCSPSSRFQLVVSDTRLPDSCRRLLPLLLRPGSRVRVAGSASGSPDVHGRGGGARDTGRDGKGGAGGGARPRGDVGGRRRSIHDRRRRRRRSRGGLIFISSADVSFRDADYDDDKPSTLLLANV